MDRSVVQEAPKPGLEGDVAFANAQVARGEVLCARQRALIASLRAEGRDSTEAETVLAYFEETFRLMQELQRRLVEESRLRQGQEVEERSGPVERSA